MRTKIAVIAGFTLLLSACGGSGGGGGGIGQDASCTEPSCGREDEPAAPSPPTGAPPVETPTDESPEPPLACGAETACPSGYRCVADAANDCDPATGMACGGTCVLGEELPRCGTVADQPCPEGYTCVDDPSDDCEGGPAVDCGGICQPRADGQCLTDADCPVLDAACVICADGTASCPSARCNGGQCTVDFKPCSEAQVCGGISGLGCDPGFTCVDDPTDECRPNEENADCRGICVPEQRPSECGGFTGAACPPGFECADAPDDMCDPADGGADCPGICKPTEGEECTTDAECPVLRAPCSTCPDGMESCPRSFCENGRCSLVYPSCPNPPGGCRSDSECPPGHVCSDEASGVMCDPNDPVGCIGVCIPHFEPRPCGGIAGDTCPEGYICTDDRRDDCNPDDGGADCPGVCEPTPPDLCRSDEECAATQHCAPCPDGTLDCSSRAVCRDGLCVVPEPNCSDPTTCESSDQCAVPTVCELCPDGSFSCAKGECLNGACIAVYPGCPDPGRMCGGIAGFPCPPGFTCIDDANDDCDPNQGGADCAGVCVRHEEPPKCGTPDGQPCPEGFECVDVAGDDCEDASRCPSVCSPAPAPPCADDADCMRIGAPCQICADGTSACPRSYCRNGACASEFPSCGTEPGRE